MSMEVENVPFQGGNDNLADSNAIVDEYDRRMLGYLARLYKSMSGKTMNLDEVKTAVDALNIYNNAQKVSYIDYLLHPERNKGCKIPSTIPVPSAAFQMHNSVTLQTNSSGNLAVMFNPFFLYDSNIIATELIDGNTYTPDFFTSFFVANDDSLTGRDGTSGFTPINIGQGIPSVYGSFRVVSASIIVKYIGRMDIASGVVGGAIILDDSSYIGSKGKYINDDLSAAVNYISTNGEYQKYSNFDLAMDSFYHQENLSLEGIKEIYFPIDNSYDEYMPTFKFGNSPIEIYGPTSLGKNMKLDKDYYKSGFNFFFYSLGAPASSSCFKFDIYVNYECLPDARFLNYMPISPPAPAISNYEKSEAIKIAQNKPVMTEKEAIISRPGNGFFEKLRKKFGQIAPSVVTLMNSGLLDGIPMIKTGLTVAGNLLAAPNRPVPSQLVRYSS